MISFIKGLVSNKADPSYENKAHSIELASLVLLIEIAKADHQFDQGEMERIASLASDCFHLSADESAAVIEQAIGLSRDATSLYEFTSTIHENLNDNEKFDLIKAMWKVAYADGDIDKYEEHLIRRIADLIYVPHARFIEAKHLAAEEDPRV